MLLYSNELQEYFKKEVIFTNGCFDLFHKGHEFLINYALSFKSFNNNLVIGVNTDRSVSKIKGYDRPVETFEKRVENLVYFSKEIDYIIPIENISVLETIKWLRPNVLIKGGSTDHIVGKSFVESYGGKVIKAPMFGEYSTSNLLKKMVKDE